MQHGEPDKGATLFEVLIFSDKRRVDVWCTYVDQLIKLNKIDSARNVLKRAVSQKKMPVKKMEILIKKYCDFAQKHGNEEDQEYIKNMSEEYQNI